MPPWALLLLALAWPLYFCAAQLNLDIWYDEAFSLHTFVERGFKAIATDYSCPNNHLFYLFLLRPFFLLSKSNVMLRLPSLFFAVGTLLCVYRVSRRHVSHGAGLLGVAWLGLNQVFLGHVMQLRGYGLSMFLLAVLADLTLRREPAGWGRRVATALVLAGFLYILPTNILFAAPLGGAALLFILNQERRERAPGLDAALPWGAGVLLAGLCYLPLFKQIFSVLGSTPDKWSVGWAYLRVYFPLLTRDAQWLWWSFPIGLVFWWRRESTKRKSADASAVPSSGLFLVAILVAFAGPFVLLGALKKGGVYSRNFTPLLPLMALFAGWMLWEVLERIQGYLLKGQRFWNSETMGILLLWVALLPWLLTYPARLSAFREHTFAQDGYFNYYSANFQVAAPLKYLKDHISSDENYSIFYDCSGFVTVDHYLARLNLPNQRIQSNKAGVKIPVKMYYLAPTLANYEDISKCCGLSTVTLSEFPLVKDFGYYKLHRMPDTLKAFVDKK